MNERSTNCATDPAARQAALVNVLYSIAQDMLALSEVLIEATQADGEDAQGALIAGALALTSSTGALADRAIRACGSSGVRGQDSWLHSPVVCEALNLLEGRPCSPT